LVLSVCGFVLLSGLLQGNTDYSALQRWAVDAQFVFLCITLVFQLLLSGNTKEQDVGGVKRVDAAVATDLLSPVANAYCSLCFMIFLVCVLTFARSTLASDAIRSWVASPNGMWYFHPANISVSDCTNGTWSDVIFNITNVANDTATHGIGCLNSSRVLYSGVHHFANNITNGTIHFQSDKSDAVQLVFGSSYAASDSASAITTQSITGSVAFALILSFISVTLFVSCYAAYSSTAMGQYCPLFLAPR
jgi:hypothetical protein